MTQETLTALDAFFAPFPSCKGRPSDMDSIREASSNLGLPFPDDYVEFVLRYGGGIVGVYPIVGLSLAEAMGKAFSTVLEINQHYRKQRWPGIVGRVVFSYDQGGNPISFDGSGRIWLVDHDHHQIVCIEPSFEAFLRRWCLEIEPGSADYLATETWPSQRL